MWKQLCVAIGLLTISGGHLWSQENWPQFRGRQGSGIGTGLTPRKWDVQSGANIRWKTAIAGLGHSSPIVWGDRVFVTTAVNSESDRPSVATGWSGGAGESAKDSGDWTWRVLCLNRNDGRVVWSRDAHRGEPTIKRHLKSSHANASPATDGRCVVAFFGSEGLYCYEFDGALRWKVDLGKLHSGPYDAPELEWGFASSPVIHEGRVIVQCDCLNANFVAILDLATGKEIRRIEREGEVATWSTPLVVTTGGLTQIVCNGYRRMAGYDLDSGEQLWTLKDGGDVPVPTPLFSDGLIYLTNGHGRSPTYAIDPKAEGDLTPEKEKPLPEGLVWTQPRDGAYMPTPLIADGLLYTCDDNGRLTVRNSATGELEFRERVGKGRQTYSASAVASRKFIYFPSENGLVSVVRRGPKFKLIENVDMKEVIMATPAIAGDQLFIRTAEHLYCIGGR